MRVIRIKVTVQDMKVYERDRTVYDQGQSFGGHPGSGHLERSQQKEGEQSEKLKGNQEMPCHENLGRGFQENA